MRAFASKTSSRSTPPPSTPNPSAATHTLGSTASKTTTATRVRSRDQLDHQQHAANLRQQVLDEVMVPGRFKAFFKPEKQVDIAGEPVIRTAKSRSSPKKVSAAAAARSGTTAWPPVVEDAAKGATGELDVDNSLKTSSPSTGRSGRQSVGWRALEEVYAREVLPHPYVNKTYLDIVQVKLLDDRKTYQYWYRPIPSGSVTADDIAHAVSQHAPALRAMLARHAYPHAPGSKRLSFQFVRQSDRIASMDQLWKQLEDEASSENKLQQRQEDGKEQK
ncbi:hypothetical protein DFQ27_008223 [Actinomortierella ambigua]|uniref:Uncharacterized protein n=1 Tax=Actinomortierella ambigua TaxID=1343610 RepID=A0A9P6TY45_9FUNG|nr:hypothetical protein DFQ27_008223 [Actinomortierella ambigua]